MTETSNFHTIQVGPSYVLSFDYSENAKKTDSKLITTHLYTKSDKTNSIAEKSFAWPEKELPEVDYDAAQGVLKLKGKRNVGQIPFRLPKLHVRLPEKSTTNGFSINVMPGFKKKRKDEEEEKVPPEHSLFENLQCVIDKPTIESNWTNLTMDCDAFEASTSLIGTGAEKNFPAETQISIAKLILQRAEINSKNAEFLFGRLLKLRIFKARIFGELVQLLLTYESVPLIRIFLKSPATFLVDEIYVKLLRFCAEQDSPADFELFDLLMEKSFTANFLHKYIESSLDSKHVGKILEMGKDMIISNGNDTYKCKRTIDLLSTLMDSYAHKLLWDDSNLPALVKMRSTLNEMIQLISSYSSLMAAHEAKTELPNLTVGPPTDYAVRKVMLKSKYV